MKPLSVGFLSRDTERFAHMDALMEQGLKLVLVMHQSFTAKLLISLIPALTAAESRQRSSQVPRGSSQVSLWTQEHLEVSAKKVTSACPGSSSRTNSPK